MADLILPDSNIYIGAARAGAVQESDPGEPGGCGGRPEAQVPG